MLEALKGFDEIVVCDMESSDQTLPLAREYGCRIVTFPRGRHTIVEPARNFAIGQVSHRWVLVVDADEIITPELRQYLYRRIEEPDCPAGLYIARQNKLLGRYNRDWSHDYQLRFFVREGTVWPPNVHTFPQVPGRVERAPAQYKMLHLADETMRQWVSKMNEYTDNEVEKKKARNYGIGALLWRPAWRFFRCFILQGGFLNGKRGYYQAVQTATYQRVMLLKIIEKKLREKG